MSGGIRQRLTYANVVASLALFIALGGSSYAAVQLSKNSVRSKHIKNGQVKRADIGSSAVDSVKVKDGSLLSRDFKAGQLPAGAKGDKGDPCLPSDAACRGPRGETGERGPSNAWTVGDCIACLGRSLSSTATTVLLELALPAGDFLISGNLTVRNYHPDQIRDGTCGVVNDTNDDGQLIGWTLARNGQPAHRQNPAPEAVMTLSAPGKVRLECRSFGTSVEAWNTRLTAIQLGSVVRP